MPKKKKQANEPDSVYMMKLVLYFILGTVWVRVVAGDDSEFSIPVGLVVGIIFASHDHFQIDRKIEYAVLFISAIISFYLPVGLII